jgi:hypothetical protein
MTEPRAEIELSLRFETDTTISSARSPSASVRALSFGLVDALE